MKQQRATQATPTASQNEWERERESAAAAIVCSALARELNSSEELTQTEGRSFLTTAVAAELDTVLPLIDFINYTRMCGCVCAFLSDFIYPASLALICLTIQYKFMHTL